MHREKTENLYDISILIFDHISGFLLPRLSLLWCLYDFGGNTRHLLFAICFTFVFNFQRELLYLESELSFLRYFIQNQI